MRIGERLVDSGVISRTQLDDALAAQMRHGGKIAKTLISLGYLDIQTFIRFVAREAGVGMIDLLNYDVKDECIDLLPRNMAVEHELLPVEKLGPVLTVAMVCPLNTKALWEVENHTGLKARPVMCTPEALWYSIKRHYPGERHTDIKESAPSDDENLLWLERQFLAASVVGLVRRTESLGRMSRTLDRLRETLRDPQASPKSLIDVIGQDPALSARILGVANGETFGFKGRVDTLDLAIRLLGPREVFRMAESTEIWFGEKHDEGFDIEAFRADAMFTSRATERIMEAMGHGHIAASRAAGLLCDIGRLALIMVAPNHYKKIDPDAKGFDLIAAEQRHLGISHPEAGYMLADRWGLPADITEAILFHHEPKRATRAKELAAAVGTAHRLADLAGATIDDGRAAFRDCLDLLQTAGLEFSACVRLITELSHLRDCNAAAH
ncbi:MAG: HDOD domain-containing protein [Candidatus Hydrogenedentes bacterium]|nr:HDOD domain-containing protein [Candidatus Hydrogenedentota bacterium]